MTPEQIDLYQLSHGAIEGELFLLLQEQNLFFNRLICHKPDHLHIPVLPKACQKSGDLWSGSKSTSKPLH